MNATTRLSNLEKRIQNVLNKDEPIWICLCGESPCSCTEDHKLSKCKKYPSGSCADCQFSGVMKFMTGNNDAI